MHEKLPDGKNDQVPKEEKLLQYTYVMLEDEPEPNAVGELKRAGIKFSKASSSIWKTGDRNVI